MALSLWKHLGIINKLLVIVILLSREMLPSVTITDTSLNSGANRLRSSSRLKSCCSSTVMIKICVWVTDATDPMSKRKIKLPACIPTDESMQLSLQK